jgi:hypothetical protein
MNKQKEKQRVAHGKPAKIVNSSMDERYRSDQDQVDSEGRALGEQAFDDLTDRQNDEVFMVEHSLIPVRILLLVDHVAGARYLKEKVFPINCGMNCVFEGISAHSASAPTRSILSNVDLLYTPPLAPLHSPQANLRQSHLSMSLTLSSLIQLPPLIHLLPLQSK